MTRQCMVTKRIWDNENGIWVYLSVPAKFHQWGSRYKEFENGPGNETVAIVEFEDGKCDSFLPSQIQFTQES